ncbi:M23 family metallopeptidase [bacterium SCSIO 12696]|nr:M23 family metallopeptidase [bacterium SCSIO 12696]
MSSTFGPRQLASQGLRYDFHRGIDLPTDQNTPLFAIAAGEVIKAGADPAFADSVIQVRHYDPDTDDCDAIKCISSVYLHVNSPVVSIGEQVVQGQMLGYSGASASGFAHLHFEIRQAPGNHDIRSNWQRDCRHPLAFLEYDDTGAANMLVTIESVDSANPLLPVVTVSVEQTNGVELDVNRLEVEVRENQSGGGSVLVAQAQHQPQGNTPESVPYQVNPPFFDTQLFNRQYTYKDSSLFPWSVFQTGGLHQSPFHLLLPASYDPHVHLDAQLPSDSQIGFFNGLTIAPQRFTSTSSEYRLEVTFNELTGVMNAADLCVRARAVDALGNATDWVDSGCQ